MAERGGFEPPVEFDPYDGLANRSFRPLRHLSATVQNVSYTILRFRVKSRLILKKNQNWGRRGGGASTWEDKSSTWVVLSAPLEHGKDKSTWVVPCFATARGAGPGPPVEACSASLEHETPRNSDGRGPNENFTSFFSKTLLYAARGQEENDAERKRAYRGARMRTSS